MDGLRQTTRMYRITDHIIMRLKKYEDLSGQHPREEDLVSRPHGVAPWAGTYRAPPERRRPRRTVPRRTYGTLRNTL